MNRKNSASISHHGVLPLPQNTKTGFVQRTNRVLVVNSGDSRQDSDRYVDFSRSAALKQFVARSEVLLNGLTDIGQSFLFSGTLRPATGQTWDMNAETFVGFVQSNSILHNHLPLMYHTLR